MMFVSHLKDWVRQRYVWEDGRGKTGYQKMLLLHSVSKWPLLFDLYVIRYPPGSRIGWHVDPAMYGMRHVRINLVLKHAVGGRFVCDRTLFRLGRLAIFRPDLERHMVTEVESGTRYVLSMGFLLQPRRGDSSDGQA